jgi:transposase, IS30 family
MGAHYRHLTRDERMKIKALLQEGFSISHIARRLGRSRSTVAREIKRNSGQRGYRPKQAQEKADERKQRAVRTKMTQEVAAHIDEKIREDFSPEQISNTMGDKFGFSVSHEWIYQHILADKQAGGDLYTHLRINGKRKRRKRYGKNDYRGKIPGRVPIEDRPQSVDERRFYGDWEADLVVGSHHRGFLVTLVERKTKLTRIGWVERKNASAVTDEIIRLLKGYRTRTITYDNGREFWEHQKVNAALGCQSFFAAPYHSWERGLNENTNGLIRQYFPKGTDLRQVTPEEIAFVEARLNNRPRKTLDFATPLNLITKIKIAA